MPSPRLSFPLLCAATFLTGCGFTASTTAPINQEVKGLHGTLRGGQQPLAGAGIQVFQLGVGAPVERTSMPVSGETTTDAAGNFTVPSFTCPTGPLTTSERGAPETAHVSGRGAAENTPKPTGKQLTLAGARPRNMAQARPAVLPDLTQQYVYILAFGGDPGGGPNSAILLAAGLGPCDTAQSQSVEINEVSTVVFATALQNYNVGTGIAGTPSTSVEAIAAMDVADADTVQAFVNLSTGLVNPNVVATEPGGTSVTIEAAKIYSMANTIASCVNSSDVDGEYSTACQTLFADVGLVTSPIDTLSAARLMAQHPYSNVKALWKLGSTKPAFTGLPTAPNDWTLGISYTTNAMGLGLFPAMDGSPTSSNIDIDSNGRVWFPSNKSGATGVGYFDPTDVTFAGPFGGTYLTQPQYVALDDANQLAYVTDLGSNNIILADTTYGSTNGVLDEPIPSDGIGSGPSSTGPLFITAYEDNADTVAIAYNDSGGGHDLLLASANSGTGTVGNNFFRQPTGLTLNTTLGTDPNDSASPVAVAASNGSDTLCSLEVVGDSQGTLPAYLSTGSAPCVSGGAATGPVIQGSSSKVQDELTAATTANEYCSQVAGSCTLPTVTPAGASSPTDLLDGPNGVAFDGAGTAWFANSGNGSLAFMSTSGAGTYSISTDRPYLHGQNNGGTMITPAGVAIDAAGNVWVSNATCTSSTDTSCSFTLSEVIGAAVPTITPLANQAAQLQGTEP